MKYKTKEKIFLVLEEKYNKIQKYVNFKTKLYIIYFLRDLVSDKLAKWLNVKSQYKTKNQLVFQNFFCRANFLKFCMKIF